MPSGTPRPPGAQEKRRGEYHLMFLAQQQIEQLQLFSARLQQQIRNLQAQLYEADDKVEKSKRDEAVKLRHAEAVRRMLPKLRERLEGLKPQGGEPDPKRDKKLAKALQKLARRIETLEQAHDRNLEAALHPPPPAAPKPAGDVEDGIGLELGDSGGLELGGGGEVDGAPGDLMETDDPFSDISLDAGDDLDEDAFQLEGSLDLDMGDLGGAALAAEPAPLPPAAAPVPAGPSSAELAQTRREMERLRLGQRMALGATALTVLLAIGLSVRGRRPAAAPAPAAAPGAPGAPQPPINPATPAEQALRLVQDRPVGRGATLRDRLDAMTPPNAPLPVDARWRVGTCDADGCDVSYTAGIIDPATAEELLYLFRAEVAQREVRGLNEPARVILKKR